MTITQIRRELKKRIDHLPEKQLRSAADYLAYLDEASEPIARAMLERIRKAEQDIFRGHVTPVSKLGRK
jgi:hypothetical protein